MSKQQQILFLSHGGGPLPLLGDPGHQEIVDCLKSLSTKLHKPAAILVISAHWEAAKPSVTTSANPELIYDYYGFPEEAYRIQYPCPGDPKLAQKIYEALNRSGIESTRDEQRGLDHGVFVPLKIMYPEADIPCVQLSLVNNLDAKMHLDIGRALRDVDYDNLLVIGSGFTFHNMRAFFGSGSSAADSKNHAFENWLLDTCTSTDLSEAERQQRLINWQDAPNARYCQPREEHLLPLHVCSGLAQSACDTSYELTVLHKKISMYLWSSKLNRRET